VNDKLKDVKYDKASLVTPEGGIRLGTMPNSLHQRVANKEAGLSTGLGNTPAFKTPVGFMNGSKIMFFADVSGSMGSSDDYSKPDQPAKIELLKQAFHSYIGNCSRALNAVGIATFPEQAYEPPTADHSLINEIVSQLSATGGTPLAAAMNYVCENEPITHGVIISDGDADSADLPKEIAKKFASKLVKLDTVHIGKSTGGESLLKEIAEITGGIYVKFTDVSNFAKTFQYLSPAKRGLLTSSKNPVALLGCAEIKI
jgi:hypothetical protein